MVDREIYELKGEVGGLKASVDTLVKTWRSQDEEANAGRRRLYDKFEELKIAVEHLASRMMDEISSPIRIDDDRLEIASSMGIALLPDDGEDFDTLMQGADLALYRSKVNGRKQVTFFDPSMTRNLVRRREIETELRLALQRDELSIFFQPLVDLETGRIRAFEAAGVPADAYGVGSSLLRGNTDFTADVVLLEGRPCAKVGRRYRANPRLERVT